MSGYVERPDREAVQRIGQFSVVGGAATALQTGLLWLLVDVASLYYVVAAVIAIEIAILSQYVANNTWTFADRANDGDAFRRGLVRTNLVRGSAIPLQIGLLFALVTWGGVGYLVANLLTIVPSGIYRYLLDKRWTWAEHG